MATTYGLGRQALLRALRVAAASAGGEPVCAAEGERQGQGGRGAGWP